MRAVEPIRDRNTIKEIYNYLENKEYNNVARLRDFVLFYVGFNTGLRISDLLRLKVKDIINKTEFYVKEGKTSKTRKIVLYKHLKDVILNYINLNKLKGWLFPARYKNTPITRKTAYMIIKKIQVKFNLTCLGTHSFRKTFGYHYYKKTHKIGNLMYVLNHYSEEETKRYIGITQEDIEEDMKDLKI